MNESVIVVSGFLSFVALIGFFFMANNIAKIRTHVRLIEKPNWYLEYTKRKSLKRSNPEILFALQEHVWNQIILKPSVKNYEVLKDNWSTTFNSLGGEFPEYPFK